MVMKQTNVSLSPGEDLGFVSEADRVRRIAQSVLSLPTLPTVVAKVVQMVQDPRTSAQDLARIIATDQVLTAKVLKLANSSYYGFPRKIGTINLAVVLLGYETVRDLVLSVSVIEKFSQPEGDLWFDYSLFWEHSMATGIACRLFAQKLHYHIVGEAFVAGLIHDIGKLVLNNYMKKEFRNILRKANTENLLFYEAEEKVLGVSHGRIGAWMVERWNLPKTIVEALAYHHHPSEALRGRQLCHLVHFCDALVRRGGYGHSGDSGLPSVDPSTVEALGLQKTNSGRVDFEPYLDELHAEMERAESLMDMVIKPKEVAG